LLCAAHHVPLGRRAAARAANANAQQKTAKHIPPRAQAPNAAPTKELERHTKAAASASFNLGQSSSRRPRTPA
jgi:hypothetical protein